MTKQPSGRKQQMLLVKMSPLCPLYGSADRARSEPRLSYVPKGMSDLVSIAAKLHVHTGSAQSAEGLGRATRNSNFPNGRADCVGIARPSLKCGRYRIGQIQYRLPSSLQSASGIHRHTSQVVANTLRGSINPLGKINR